ncbi:MAG TPA: zinc ribbon domain-containing protein [Pyrinomonadaceae bacterium]|nr:zinc ribbon domain-containing protein [Pyrinomonadaceae bacterium]
MYCSSCGVAISQGLSYCNHCGAKLNRGESGVNSSEVKPDLLVTAMVASFVFGLAVITALMGVMKVILGLPVERVLAFALMPFLLLLIMEGVFIRLLLRRNQPAEVSGTTLSEQQATNELDAAQARVLPEATPSVTEHTTRAFDPIYTERK